MGCCCCGNKDAQRVKSLVNYSRNLGKGKAPSESKIQELEDLKKKLEAENREKERQLEVDKIVRI